MSNVPSAPAQSQQLLELADVLHAVALRSQRLEAQAFWLVRVPPTGAPVVQQHATAEELALSLRGEAPKGGWLLAFAGERLPLAGNPDAGVLDLLLPDGRRLQVLSPPPAIEPDSDQVLFVRQHPHVIPPAGPDAAAGGP